MKAVPIALLLLAITSQAAYLRQQTTLQSDGEYTNELYHTYAEEIHPEYSEDSLISSEQICRNIVVEVTSFGKDALDTYNTTEEQYYLLGGSHPLIQQDQPLSVIHLNEAMCPYEIIKNTSNPHSNDLRTFITSTIKGCVKSTTQTLLNSAFECPTLNDKLMIENENQFCQNVESMRTYQPEGATNDDLDFRLYQFTGKGQYKPCMAIVSVYNYCMSVSDILGLSISNCLRRTFDLYDDGAVIKKYNKKANDMCQNIIMPFLGYFDLDHDIFNPSDSYGLCSNLKSNIENIYLQRKSTLLEQIEKQQNYTEKNQTRLEKLSQIKNQINVMVSDMKLIFENWTNTKNQLDKYLPENITTYNVSQTMLNNINLLNFTIVDWISQVKAFYGYLEKMKTDETLEQNLGSILKTIKKLHILSNHTQEFAEFIIQLIKTQKVDGKQTFSLDSWKKTDYFVSNSKSVFEEMITDLNKKAVAEISEIEGEVQTSKEAKSKFEDYEVQFAKQIAIFYEYFQ